MGNLLRRRTSRSTQARLSAPNGGGIGRMFVSCAAFFGVYFKQSRQFASRRVGFVLVLPITLRLGLTHARLSGLRAANLTLPAVVLSVASVSLSVSSLFCSLVPGQSLGSPGASGDVLVLLSVPLFSSSSRPLSTWLGRLSLPLSFFVCVILAPRVSRLTLTHTFWSSR